MRLNTSVTEWRCTPPAVDVTRLLRVHKYTDQSKVRPVIRAAAAKAVADAAKLSAPEARYVAAPIKLLKNGELFLEDGCKFECAAFDQHLSGSQYLLAFVMTLGSELDQTVLKLVEDVFEPLDALFLETAGWLTIEAATKHLARHLKQEFGGLGWTLSLRMGPGYDYRAEDSADRVRWDLWQQRELFQMFKAAALPVDLMESCAMKPKMSRSGVFGLLPADG